MPAWMQVVARSRWVLLPRCGSGPTVLLLWWAGVLADRFDKRRLRLVAQVGLGGCALASAGQD